MSMRAMVLRETGPVHERALEWTELPVPTPGPGEIRLRVNACAICRTDLHVIEADLEPQTLPIVPGHQVVGTVDSCGDGCRRFRGGERVGVAWLRETCGTCDDCRRGSENLCVSSRYTGYHDDGGYADYCVVREDFAYALPDAFGDLQAAPLLCAGIVGYRALTRAALPDGGRLGLFGFGSSAHVVLQIARHRGASVYVATRGKSHRELARRLGADWVGETYDPPPDVLDSAIVFAPAGEVVPAALRALRKGGTAALAGIHMSPVPAMDYEPHLFHEKTLTSVEANTRSDGHALLEIAAAIPIRPEVTTFPLQRANDALLLLKQDRVDGTAVLVP